MILSVIGLISVGYLYSSKEDLCGDETLYGNCSSNKPYFCDNGGLISKADFCGCPEGFYVSGEECFSEFMITEKNIFLIYSLEEEEKEISFNLYEEVYNYSKSRSRFIVFKGDEVPSKKNFKIESIENQLQKDFLIPLVVEIQNVAKNKKDQAEIAINIVQNIPYSERNFTDVWEEALSYRYPYEVLYENQGICSEKSDLLAFLLKELGYGVVIFYFPEDNHEAVGIKCSSRDYQNTGYCYIESTSSFDIELSSVPEVIEIADGESFD